MGQGNDTRIVAVPLNQVAKNQVAKNQSQEKRRGIIYGN